MIKKFIIGIVMLLVVLGSALTGTTYASSLEEPTTGTTTIQTTNKLEEQTNSNLVEMKQKTENELKAYEEQYGSKSYGYTAYILNKIKIFSIPLCFIGIAVGSLYQYVIGIRKLDVRDKGFALIIGFVTVLVICQLLPLIFAIVVNGWRG